MKAFVFACVMTSVWLSFAGCGPSDFEKQKLAFEMQKYQDEQTAKTEAARKEAEDKEEQSTRWKACRYEAGEEFNREFSHWGEPVPGKPGIRNGPTNQYEDMKNREQRQNEQCDRNFPKGVSW
jgi:hypothetical protein